MQRDFSAYDQEDEYGTQSSRERGGWQSDWSDAGRARLDGPRNERNERYGNSRDYGRDDGRDYDRDYGSRVSQGSARHQGYGGQSMQRGSQGWESQAQQRDYGPFGSQGNSSMDMRHRQGPKGYSRSDERIREDVCERLCMAHELAVHDVSVQVKDGRVDLQGSVPERWMKHAIEDCAEQCFGVQDVENRIRTQSSHGDHSHGGTGSGTSASQRTSGQTGTVGTAGAHTASGATGSSSTSSGTSGSGNDAGKHH